MVCCSLGRSVSILQQSCIYSPTSVPGCALFLQCMQSKCLLCKQSPIPTAFSLLVSPAFKIQVALKQSLFLLIFHSSPICVADSLTAFFFCSSLCSCLFGLHLQGKLKVFSLTPSLFLLFTSMSRFHLCFFLSASFHEVSFVQRYISFPFFVGSQKIHSYS